MANRRGKLDRRNTGKNMPQWIYHNPDVGTEMSPNHPVQSGECPDATNIRPLSNRVLTQELLESWRSMAELEKSKGQLAERNTKLANSLAFAASVIKSGEPWTATCQREIGDVLNPPDNAEPPAAPPPQPAPHNTTVAVVSSNVVP